MDSGIDILLAEDKNSDAELAVRALRKNKMANQILHVKDGKAVIDFLFAEGAFAGRDTEQVPKVIFLDLKMPKLNGIDVLKKIKEDKRTKKIPVVVLTSSQEDRDIRHCYDLGVNSYIVKPVGFDDFSRVVGELGVYWTSYNQPPTQ